MSTQTRFRIEGMDCASCAAKIDTAVRRVAGGEDVSVSVSAGTMSVQHTPESDLEALARTVASLGYKVNAVAGAPARAPAAPAACCGHDHGSGCGHDPAHKHTHDHPHKHEAHKHEPHGHDHAEAQTDTVSLHGHDHGPTSGAWWRSSKGALTLACGAALALAYGVGHLFPRLEPGVFIAALLVGLLPIARRALMAALNGTPFSIEMLMSIAAVGAVIIGASEEAAAVVFLFLIGELLEGVAASKARASIQSLASLVPKTALIEKDGATREVAAQTLAIGDIILVRPGDRIPADGTILSGESAINEAPVTGESMPVRKGVDASVFAGTVNGDGALRLQVSAAAADNTIARVVRLVEEAQEAKAPTERLIDRFSRYYTPGVMAVAALVAAVPPLLFGGAWGEWVYKGLAILLIGCPCALVISVPAAIAASLSAGARRGLLIKGGAVLETLGKTTVVCLDKTGTLTLGKPVVTDIIALEASEADVLRFAAAVETGASHPLALAILAKAEGLSLPAVEEAQAHGGKGVSGRVEGRVVFLGSAREAGARASLPPQVLEAVATLHDAGKSTALLLLDGAPAGIIAMRDEPRADAAAGLKALAQRGIRTVMLTGDNARAAKAIGSTLGIEVRAELLPQDKQRIVGEFKAQGQVVAKVGDGINDAPALAAADVGIAMGGGTDVALETADAAVLHGRVGDIDAMIALSRRTLGNIRQNITLALGLKAVFLVTTVLGITGLWPAILADTGATVLVTLNALRLLRLSPVATS
ncbi:MAG: cadmium-translocating P-type ATPase [Proteobacteria bacterium]|nr:cadmium-translocating P-type ATPase [Pseudomonadota bacterium]